MPTHYDRDLRSDNGDVHENVAEKQTSHDFKLFGDYPNSPFYLKEGILAGAEERGTHSSSDGDGRIYRLSVPVPFPKYTWNLVISRRSCAVKAKKCTKKRDARAELSFCSLNLLLFWRFRCLRRRDFARSLIFSHRSKVSTFCWIGLWNFLGFKKLIALLVLVVTASLKQSYSAIRHLKDPVSQQLKVARAPLPIFARLYNTCTHRVRVQHGFTPRFVKVETPGLEKTCELIEYCLFQGYFVNQLLLKQHAPATSLRQDLTRKDSKRSLTNTNSTTYQCWLGNTT